MSKTRKPDEPEKVVAVPNTYVHSGEEAAWRHRVQDVLDKPDEYAGGQGPEHGYKALMELLKEALRLPPPQRLDPVEARHPLDFRCSFCDKPRGEVKKLVSGPGVFICNECAQLVQDITYEQATRAPGDEDNGAIVQRVRGELDRIGFLTQLTRGELDIELLLAHVVSSVRHPLVRYIAELEAKTKKQDG
jgi:hypothetical protein